MATTNGVVKSAKTFTGSKDNQAEAFAKYYLDEAKKYDKNGLRSQIETICDLYNLDRKDIYDNDFKNSGIMGIKGLANVYDGLSTYKEKWSSMIYSADHEMLLQILYLVYDKAGVNNTKSYPRSGRIYNEFGEKAPSGPPPTIPASEKSPKVASYVAGSILNSLANLRASDPAIDAAVLANTEYEEGAKLLDQYWTGVKTDPPTNPSIGKGEAFAIVFYLENIAGSNLNTWDGNDKVDIAKYKTTNDITPATYNYLETEMQKRVNPPAGSLVVGELSQDAVSATMSAWATLLHLLGKVWVRKHGAVKLNPTSPPGGKINVLSYNVEWKIGKNNLSVVPGSCKSGGNVICITNIAKLIDDAARDHGKLDFVGLQEATNVNKIIAESTELQRMIGGSLNFKGHVVTQGVDVHPTFPQNEKDFSDDRVAWRNDGLANGYAVAYCKSEHITLFWDKDKYTPISTDSTAIRVGCIRGGRPYLMVKFNGGLVVINIHSPHWKGTTPAQLGDGFNLITPRVFAKNDSFLKDAKRIILMGDFNMNMANVPNSNWTSRNSGAKTLTFTSQSGGHGASKDYTFNYSDGLETCCETGNYGKGQGQSHKFTNSNDKTRVDHILDTYKPVQMITTHTTPKFLKITHPASDHLPVFASLEDGGGINMSFIGS